MLFQQQQNVPTFKLVLCGDGGTGKVRDSLHTKGKQKLIMPYGV